jgi:methylglyoxal synthase
MMKFVKDNLKFFKSVNLVTTGSTGRALTGLGLTVDTLVSSGPLGKSVRKSAYMNISVAFFIPI